MRIRSAARDDTAVRFISDGLEFPRAVSELQVANVAELAMHHAEDEIGLMYESQRGRHGDPSIAALLDQRTERPVIGLARTEQGLFLHHYHAPRDVWLTVAAIPGGD